MYICSKLCWWLALCSLLPLVPRLPPPSALFLLEGQQAGSQQAGGQHAGSQRAGHFAGSVPGSQHAGEIQEIESMHACVIAFLSSPQAASSQHVNVDPTPALGIPDSPYHVRS